MIANQIQTSVGREDPTMGNALGWRDYYSSSQIRVSVVIVVRVTDGKVYQGVKTDTAKIRVQIIFSS
jgi:hypothetical protein